jgi:hypothetical protein
VAAEERVHRHLLYQRAVLWGGLEEQLDQMLGLDADRHIGRESVLVVSNAAVRGL